MPNPSMNSVNFNAGNFNEVAKIMWTASTKYDCRLIGTVPVNYDFAQLQLNQTNEFDDNNDDNKALVDALRAAGIQTPNNATIKVVRDDPNTFHVVVREQSLARTAIEGILGNGGTYEMHSDLEEAYKAFFRNQGDGSIDGPSDASKAKRVEIADYRLVDYTFGTCAS